MGNKNIVVVGGGPAGMMAAIRAGQLGCRVSLIEKNATLGRKLLLSGKGRCNLTNACDLDSFLKRFSANGQFLRDAFKLFFNQELMEFFEKRGLRLKTERQQRVFPVSDKSASILGVLKKELYERQVEIIFGSSVENIFVLNRQVIGYTLSDRKLRHADKIILACGGASYKFTGSDGRGLELARGLGHTIIPLKPGLVPLVVKQRYPQLLEGLTLKNIQLKFSDGKRNLLSEVGELIFTDNGISGPLVLTLSGRIFDWLDEGKEVFVDIDLKPGLSREQLERRLLREFKLYPKKTLKNALKSFLPLRLIAVFLEISAIDAGAKLNQITLSERQRLIDVMKGLRLGITGTLPIEEAMVTRGGVSLKDINPRTMESRIIKGLYFCGEMIDIDADTGGFNLQAAFSTGYLAGQSVAVS